MPIMKTALDIMVEQAQNEKSTEMYVSVNENEFYNTYSELDILEQDLKFKKDMVPVYESTDSAEYYVEFDQLSKYMKSYGIRSIKEALMHIAECNEISEDYMVIVIESDDFAETVLSEAKDAAHKNDKSKLEKLNKVSKMIKDAKAKGIKIKKKKPKDKDKDLEEACILFEQAFNESFKKAEAPTVSQMYKEKETLEKSLKAVKEHKKWYASLTPTQRTSEATKRTVKDFLKLTVFAGSVGAALGVASVVFPPAILGAYPVGIYAGSKFAANSQKKGKPALPFNAENYQRQLDNIEKTLTKGIAEMDKKIKKAEK